MGVVGDLTLPRAFPRRFLFNQEVGCTDVAWRLPWRIQAWGPRTEEQEGTGLRAPLPVPAASASLSLRAVSLFLCTHVCTRATDTHPF